ncbi:MAG: dienelactone hydrolase family protein [Croceibacterium sp.]
MKRAPFGCLLAGALAACTTVPSASPAEQHYYARPTTVAGAAHPWVLIMPGGGGIEVFGDKQFYFDVARRWNDAGFDALIVHYQEAAPLLGITDPAMGTMEAAVARDALAAAERNGWLDLQCPGFVTGFSAGGAGTLTLAADPPANLAGAVGYYPLVAVLPQDLTPKVPVLVLQGDKDELTTLAALESFLGPNGEPTIEVHRYPEGQHGFDIPSLAKPVEFNGGTFEYHAASAKAANTQEAAFRDSIMGAQAAASGCAA